MKRFYIIVLLTCSIQSIHAQSWNITGNSGLTTANFLGSTDNHDVIFKANNAERGRLAAAGFWRFGNATNYAKVDSSGKLTFGGTGVYQVAGNKYAFQYTGNPNYGLFFNSTSVQYEFRNGSAAPVFSINANTGNSVFNGTLKIGAYTLPSADGTNGQVLTTNGSGTVSWSTASGSSISANKTLSNLTAPTAINIDLLPQNDNSLNLGSSAKEWENIYLKGNLFYGSYSLLKVDTINLNTSLGQYALINNSGMNNTAIGAFALAYNTNGSQNIANGKSALEYNSTGYNNTANGAYALLSNTTGNDNTASGSDALYSNTTGAYNVANGSLALVFNTTGYSNVAIGTSALYNNTVGNNLVAVGDSALYNQSVNSFFIFNNTALGSKALYGNTTGYNNTATGFQSLYTNSTGYNNTANGVFTLYSNTSGVENVANGVQALYSNTTGNYNTANGALSLVENTTGSENAANGANALYSNTTGYYNTANGAEALYSNTTGGYNIANGVQALYSNTTGGFNTANGSLSLYGNTTGSENSANGGDALYSNTTGYNNTANGAVALYSNTTGDYNTALGFFADVASSNLSNATAIGNSTVVDASNKTRIGNTDVTSIGGQVGWTSFSDGRYKKNIKEDIQGLKFINLLKPITYTVDINSLNNYYDKNRKHDSAYNKMKADMQPSADAASKIIYNGFIAQDVEKAAQSINYNFSGVDKPQNKDGLYGLRYADFVVPLVKSVQELSKMNDSKDAAIDSLKQQNADLQKQMNDLKTLVLQIQQQQQSCACSASVTSGSVQQYNVNLSNAASLEQNVPNPFANATTIGYTLPQKFSSAQIIIADKSGKVLKQLNLSGAGKGTVHVDAAMLASGAYNYTLYVDGRMIDSKQMVTSK